MISNDNFLGEEYEYEEGVSHLQNPYQTKLHTNSVINESQLVDAAKRIEISLEIKQPILTYSHHNTMAMMENDIKMGRGKSTAHLPQPWDMILMELHIYDTSTKEN